MTINEVIHTPESKIRQAHYSNKRDKTTKKWRHRVAQTLKKLIQ